MNTVLPWIALGVAVIGGIPGLLHAVNFFAGGSVKINFDKTNSTAIRVQSSSDKLANRVAVLLYRINFAGKRQRPMYIADIRIEIEIGKWIVGERFYPTQRDVTDKNGATKDDGHLHPREGHGRGNGFTRHEFWCL